MCLLQSLNPLQVRPAEGQGTAVPEHKLFIGMNFEFFEGKHKIGHGTIQEIVNEKLAIKS